jgi:hypothetical protein
MRAHHVLPRLGVVDDDEPRRLTQGQASDAVLEVTVQESPVPTLGAQSTAPLDHQPRLACAALARPQPDAGGGFVVAPPGEGCELVAASLGVEGDDLVGRRQPLTR